MDGVPLRGKNKEEREAARQARFRVGMVFQYPEHQLFEETVYADIAFGPRNQRLSESEVEARVKEAMDLVHLVIETVLPLHFPAESADVQPLRGYSLLRLVILY